MNFVISLKNATDRRKHINAEFKKHKIDFNFFDAVNKCNLEHYQNKFGIIFDDEKFMDSEKGCFLSHVVLWDYCISNDLKYIAIYEDDVYLGENANRLLSNFDWIPHGVDLIKIEKFEESVLMSLKRINIKEDFCLKLLQQKHLGTAGYIISINGARALMEQLKDNIQKHPIDELIFNINIKNNAMKVYQLLPSLVMQADRLGHQNLPSQIQLERSNREAILAINDNNKNILKKIKYEFIRIVNQIKLNFCKINFHLGQK